MLRVKTEAVLHPARKLLAFDALMMRTGDNLGRRAVNEREFNTDSVHLVSKMPAYPYASCDALEEPRRSLSAVIPCIARACGIKQ